LCRGHGTRRTRGWMVAQGWNINEELVHDGSCQYLSIFGWVVEHHGYGGGVCQAHCWVLREPPAWVGSL